MQRKNNFWNYHRLQNSQYKNVPFVTFYNTRGKQCCLYQGKNSLIKKEIKSYSIMNTKRISYY